MKSYQNKAIFLGTDGKHSIKVIEDEYKPTGLQSLVEVKYSAINPADTRHYYMGMSSYVAGYEFVGKIIERGPSSPFNEGQTIFGLSIPFHRRPLHLGAHQSYLMTEPSMTRVCPDDMPLITAAGLPAGAQTSLDALFNMLGFSFPAAGLDGDDPTGVPILIWGGSGAVGQAAIRLAHAAGFMPILTTASSRNHQALLAVGATHCFDYHDANVIDQIQQTMESLPGKKRLATVFDTISSGLGIFEGLSPEQEEAVKARYAESTPAQARRCCDSGPSAEELKLCATLPVHCDPTWKFCLAFRTVETMDHGDRGEALRENSERQTKHWADHIERGMDWIVANHKSHWPAPKTRIVKTAEGALEAIRDVYEGKAGGEKVLIEHPL